jgi:beta-N-acetylhexosaminidase
VRRFTALFAFAALLGGCASQTGADPTPAPRLPALSLQQLAGQRVILSYAGLTPPPSLLAQIRSGQAAGVILFGENIASRAQIEAAIAALQRASLQSPLKAPLLIMTDQEGGVVHRLPGAPVLSEKQVGEAPDPESAARRAGRGAALNVSRVGINVNLAPVLDVYRRPGNFIDQYGRSFSDNPLTVARLGADFIVGQQQLGVAATAKHFPGLGAAAQSQNTDLVPVTLDVPLRSLRAVDELPYQSAIAAGVRLVMVSWARYPALDPNRPAGLSPIVVQGELRRRLGFAGVTITDDLGAGALAAYGEIPARAVLAAGAGMDLLLCADRSVAEGVSAVDALASALRRNQLARPAFLAAVKRVLALRAQAGKG